MCNDFRLTRAQADIAAALAQAGLPLMSSPLNLEPQADIRITDAAPVVRLGATGAEMVSMRWSWPGPGGEPVYNFRSDGRRFPSSRCLIPADVLNEFTPPADPKARRKVKWAFSFLAAD